MLKRLMMVAVLVSSVQGMVRAQSGLPAFADMQTVREKLGNGSLLSTFSLKLHGMRHQLGLSDNKNVQKAMEAVILANMGKKTGKFEGSSMPCSLEVERPGVELTVYAIGRGPDPDNLFPGARWTIFPWRSWSLDVEKSSLVNDPFSEEGDAKLFYTFDPGTLIIQSFHWEKGWGVMQSETCRFK